MRATKRKTEAAVMELDERIDRAVQMKLQAEELQAQLKAETEAIKSLMKDAELERQATAAGNEALRVQEERLSWCKEKLSELLERDELETYVPRKPDGTKLRQWLETLGGEEARDLRKCAKASKCERLELRAKGKAEVPAQAAGD